MTKTITIQKIPFDISTPYAEGHACTEAEAKALNQTRSENIRNNQAKLIRAAQEAAGVDAEGNANPLAPEVMKELVASVKAYDKAYVFTLASVGGGRKSRDPIEVEAMKMARAALAAHLKSKGMTFKSVDKDKLDSALADIAGREGIVKAATKAVKERNALAESAVADIDI